MGIIRIHPSSSYTIKREHRSPFCKMRRNTDVLFVVPLLLGVVVAQVSVPIRPNGLAYMKGDSSAPVQIDLFVDLMCPYSKLVFPVLLKVAKVYGPRKVRLLTHQFPLPYHRNAFLASQGVFIAALNPPGSAKHGNLTNGVDAAYAWMNRVFSLQDVFSGDSTHLLSEKDVMWEFSAVAQGLGFSHEEFYDKLNTPEAYYPVRADWKYGCTRGVAGTPWTFINGIELNPPTSTSVANWRTIIDPLLGE